jgi:hypothetical protein
LQEGNAFTLLRRGWYYLLDRVSISGRVVPGKMIRSGLHRFIHRLRQERLQQTLSVIEITPLQKNWPGLMNPNPGILSLLVSFIALALLWEMENGYSQHYRLV